MYGAKNLREQSIARHGIPDACLSVLKDEQRRNHPSQCPDDDDGTSPATGAEHLQRVSDRSRSRIAGDERRVLQHAKQHNGDANVEQRADNQRRNDANWQVALRIARLLGRGRDGIEADVREEHDRAARYDPTESGGREWPPITRIHQRSADHQENEDGANLDRHHDVVRFGGFAHTAHQQDRQDKDNQKCREIEVRARPVARLPHGSRPSVG